MDTQDIATALGRTDLFAGLNRRALNRLAAAAKVVQHEPGKAVADQGGAGVGFHLIVSGQASVTVGGRTRPDLGPGDYFGEVSLVDGKPRSASVTALTYLTTVSITAWDVRPLFDQEPDVMRVLLVSLCARLRAAEGRAAADPVVVG
jgi:CRP/FNR family cyclic AMP-dependent transcriptional regulator